MLAACNNDGCLENGSAIPLAGFYSSETGAAISLNTVSVLGVGAPDSTMMLSAGSSASEVYLPMRSQYSTTEWHLIYKQDGLEGIEDYIKFTYDSQPHFASQECGAMYFYKITDVEYSTFMVDSVAVTDSLITNVDRQRIRIYFRTASPGEDEQE